MDIRQGICPLCQHNEIIETKVAEFGHNDLERRMCATYDERWVISGRNPVHGHGPLNLYTCRSCGFSQWFAENPQEIPISDDLRTRLIKGDS
jgi:rubrerythrin